MSNNIEHELQERANLAILKTNLAIHTVNNHYRKNLGITANNQVHDCKKPS